MKLVGLFSRRKHLQRIIFVMITCETLLTIKFQLIINTLEVPFSRRGLSMEKIKFLFVGCKGNNNIPNRHYFGVFLLPCVTVVTDYS